MTRRLRLDSSLYEKRDESAADRPTYIYIGRESPAMPATEDDANDYFSDPEYLAIEEQAAKKRLEGYARYFAGLGHSGSGSTR